MRTKAICINLVLLLKFSLALTIHRDTLSNGLVMLFSEAHKIPMVELKFIVRAGSVYDPEDREGLANMTAQMLLRGTRFNTAEKIIEKIEYLGATINVNTYEDYIEIATRGLKKDLLTIIEILAECILSPSFDPLEFKKLQTQTYSLIKSRLDDPFYLGQVEFRKLLFNGHPLNHDPIGFDSTINKIDIDDIKNFYDSYYAANNSIIVAIGDFSSDSLAELIKRYFSTWERKNIPVISTPLPELNGKKGLIIKKDISQSYIFFGFLGPAYKEPDWIPTRIMNYILGGSGLTSRLATEIREKRGLAYAVFSFFDRFNYGGYFVAGAQTKNESANEAVNLIIKEIRRIKEGVSLAELERAKKYYIGNFPLTIDTYREMANFITRLEIESLGTDYPDNFEKIVRGVTLGDIKLSANKYLDSENFCLVIIGDINANEIGIEDIEWGK